MSLSRLGKVAVAVAAGITAIIGGAKSLADVVAHLNGWHVLFMLSLFVLAIMGADFFKQWLAHQFGDLKVLHGEAMRRWTGIASDVEHLEVRLAKLERWIHPPSHA